MSDHFRILADFAADAIFFGLIANESVVVWADELIAASTVPEPWVIALSLADVSDSLAVLSALRDVPGTPDMKRSLELLNGLVFREWQCGRLTPTRVRGIGWTLYLRHREWRELTGWGIAVEDASEGVDHGWCSEAELHERISIELDRFETAAYEVPAWAMLTT